MSLDIEQHDDSKRRAFRPPKQRRPRRRVSLPSPDLWRFRREIGIGVVRAACAVGFALYPGVAIRFADSALTVLSLIMGVGVAALVFLIYRAGRPIEWQMLADSTTLIVLMPVLITASAIEVADARFGGRGVNFLAAAAALVLLFLVVTTIATRGWADRRQEGQTGALPAAFSITIVLLGTNHFSAGGMWRGLSIAWMAAAVVTVLSGVVPARMRPLVVPVAFMLFAVGVVVVNASAAGRALSSGASAIAALAVASVAAILILAPLIGPALTSQPPPEQ